MSEMLELPDWFEGGYVDVEDLVMQYFSKLLGDKVFLCTALPPGHYVLTDSTEVGGTQPTLRVWRQPGQLDPDLRRDEALVQIAAITPTRKESWKLTDFVRRMMEHDVFAGYPVVLSDGEKHAVSKSEQWVGPQLIPELAVDEKFIPTTFKIGVREPVGLPNYRKIINSLAT